MVCTVFNPTLEIARQEVQEVATDDVVLEKVEDAFAHFSIKYSNFFNILLFHYILLQSKILFTSILSKCFCIPFLFLYSVEHRLPGDTTVKINYQIH